MLALVKKFLFESTDPREILNVDLPSNDSQWDEIREKVERAKATLGEKYLLHPSNRVQRKPESEAA